MTPLDSTMLKCAGYGLLVGMLAAAVVLLVR